jgi:transcriptional regulator with XRE-family HTH domain
MLKENIYNIVAQNIKKYRIAQNITLKELAKLTGYSYAYLRRIEAPKCPKNFSLLTISIIANALNIDIKYLFNNDTYNLIYENKR